MMIVLKIGGCMIVNRVFSANIGGLLEGFLGLSHNHEGCYATSCYYNIFSINKPISVFQDIINPLYNAHSAIWLEAWSNQ